MIFDKQEHKDMIQAMLEQANFPGRMLEAAYDLKKAVESAEVKKPE